MVHTAIHLGWSIFGIMLIVQHHHLNLIYDLDIMIIIRHFPVISIASFEGETFIVHHCQGFVNGGRLEECFVLLVVG